MPQVLGPVRADAQSLRPAAAQGVCLPGAARLSGSSKHDSPLRKQAVRGWEATRGNSCVLLAANTCFDAHLSAGLLGTGGILAAWPFSDGGKLWAVHRSTVEASGCTHVLTHTETQAAECAGCWRPGEGVKSRQRPGHVVTTDSAEVPYVHGTHARTLLSVPLRLPRTGTYPEVRHPHYHLHRHRRYPPAHFLSGVEIILVPGTPDAELGDAPSEPALGSWSHCPTRPRPRPQAQTLRRVHREPSETSSRDPVFKALHKPHVPGH